MKRNLEIDVIEYAIIETIEIGEVFVQFIPSVWLVALEGKVYKTRDSTQFYYPRRLPKQSQAKHLKTLKEAKFLCLKPENDGKWELREGRILKLGLESIETAIEQEKLFMEFFSTTDAEASLAKAAATKSVKKTKKAPAKKTKTPSSSESDGESPAHTKISNYNARFEDMNNLLELSHNNDHQHDQANPNLYTLGNINTLLLENQDLLTLDDERSYILSEVPLRSVNDYTIQATTDGNQILTDSNILGVNDANMNQPNEFETAIPVTDGEDLEHFNSMISGQQNSSVQSNCKCLQKVLNKFEYFSKKVFKELASIREEVRLNRCICIDRSNSIQIHDENIDPNSEGQAVLTEDEYDNYNSKYKTIFPAKDFDVLFETNELVVSDTKFKFYLRSKFEKIPAANETKIARKILKWLCDVLCLNQCTWNGTKKKDGTIKKKSFCKLEAIVELIVSVIEKKNSDCNGMAVLKGVVQQRTKSAGEAVGNLNEKSQDVNKEQAPTTVSSVINNEKGSTANPENDNSVEYTAENSNEDGDGPEIDAELDETD